MKIKKTVPFSFVLEELERLSPYTRAMFGCTAIYVDDKIVLLLRERDEHPEDNGLWVATVAEHHASLRKQFPALRSIQAFGPGPTGWQVLPSDVDGFEESAIEVCKLVRNRDPRIGKIPAKKR
jgi:hypothetical protein